MEFFFSPRNLLVFQIKLNAKTGAASRGKQTAAASGSQAPVRELARAARGQAPTLEAPRDEASFSSLAARAAPSLIDLVSSAT